MNFCTLANFYITLAGTCYIQYYSDDSLLVSRDFSISTFKQFSSTRSAKSRPVPSKLFSVPFYQAVIFLSTPANTH